MTCCRSRKVVPNFFPLNLGIAAHKAVSLVVQVYLTKGVRNSVSTLCLSWVDSSTKSNRYSLELSELS